MKKINLRAIVVTAVMGAIGTILMYLEFSVPFMPSFIKFDVSELPALVTTFAFGPLYGVLTCLVKNLLHLFGTTTVGVGELANFFLGAVFVGTAGIIYKKKKNRKGALVACLIGTVLMCIVSIFSNYFIMYPFYSAAYGMSTEMIINAYKAILPAVDNLWQCLIVFNTPFNI